MVDAFIKRRADLWLMADDRHHGLHLARSGTVQEALCSFPQAAPSSRPAPCRFNSLAGWQLPEAGPAWSVSGASPPGQLLKADRLEVYRP
jgi:hypothetical protein